MTFRPIFAFAALLSLTASASAWEVVGSSLPTFAQGDTSGSSLVRPWSALTGDPFAGSAAIPSGYDFRVGKNLFVGVQQSSGLSAGSILGSGLSSGFASGGDFSSTQIKLGYDLGRLTPYVTAGFGEARSSAFGPSSFAGAPALGGPLSTNANPFAATSSVTKIGAGFDYALSDKVTIGVGVSAIQASPGFQASPGWRP